MPPLCNSDRVTTLAYVTHGPATPAAPSPAYPLPRKMIIMNQRVVVGVTGCYCVVTDAVTTATALTPRVTAVTPRVTPRPMLPLCNSDRVTTLAYVTRGPARPRPKPVAERAGQQNQIPEAKSQAGAGRTTTPWVGWPQGRRAGAPGEARHRISDPDFMATGTHMP